MNQVDQMTSRERLEAVMKGEVPDRVPVFCHGHGIARHMLGISYGDMVQSVDLMSKAILAWQDMIGEDRLWAYFDMMTEAAGFGQPMVFQTDQPPYSEKNDLLIKSAEDYLKLEPYDPEVAERTRMTLEVAEILREKRGDQVCVASLVSEPFVVLGLLRGMEDMLMDCVRHPEEVMYGLRVVTDVIIDYMRAMDRRGVDLVVMCHDYGNKSIMSERLWRKLELEQLARYHEAVRETDLILDIHNCDAVPYIDAAFDDLGGLDIYECAALPASCADMGEYKQKYGSRAVLHGMWWPIELAALDYDQVLAKSKAMIEALAPGGRFILGPTCEFPSHGPIANAKALVDASRMYGTY
jgi:uroporphyrinogen decarboxylase